MQPFGGGIDQICYVTADLALAIEVAGRAFGASEFRRFELEFPVRVGTVRGTFSLGVALARLGGDLKLELIQPRRDVHGFYSDCLAPGREAALGLHHLGSMVKDTDPAVWEMRLAQLERDGLVYCTGDLGPSIRFTYVDERARLGHFVEHYWLAAAP